MRSQPKHRPNPHAEFEDVEIGRNTRYADSVILGLERGILRAPTSLLNLVGWAVLSLLVSVVMIVLGLVLWAALRIHFVGAGVFGILRKKHIRRDQSALTHAQESAS